MGCSPIRRPDGLAAIFHQRQLVPLAQGDQLVHSGRIAEHLDADHGLRSGADVPFHLGGLHVQASGVAVDEDGLGPDVLDAVGRRDEAQRGREHLVSGSNAQCEQGQMQPRRPRADPDAVRPSGPMRDHRLEFLELRTEAQASASQHMHHGADLGFGDVRIAQRDCFGHLGLTSAKGRGSPASGGVEVSTPTPISVPHLGVPSGDEYDIARQRLPCGIAPRVRAALLQREPGRIISWRSSSTKSLTCTSVSPSS